MAGGLYQALPLLQGHRNALIAIHTDTGIGFAYLVPFADQAHTIKALQWMIAVYGMLLGIQSVQETHFTEAQIQQQPKTML